MNDFLFVFTKCFFFLLKKQMFEKSKCLIFEKSKFQNFKKSKISKKQLKFWNFGLDFSKISKICKLFFQKKIWKCSFRKKMSWKLFWKKSKKYMSTQNFPKIPKITLRKPCDHYSNPTQGETWNSAQDDFILGGSS